MSGRVGGELSLVVPRSNDFAVDDNDRPNRNVAVWYRQFRLSERHAHQRFVIHVLKLVVVHDWRTQVGHSLAQRAVYPASTCTISPVM